VIENDCVENDLFIFMRKNVVKWLIFHCKKQCYSCGNLKRCVEKESNHDDKDLKIRAKLLPSMIESKDFVEDTKQLRKIMKSVISHHSIRDVDIPCFELNHHLERQVNKIRNIFKL
jgi:hypothetical protein